MILARVQIVLNALATLLVPGALAAVFFVAPREAEMGVVQKIFYFHVPSAMVMMLLFILAGLLSVAYLVRPRQRLDQIAAACVDIGVVFAVIVLTTGPLWGRKSWGAYWTFEPRLNLTLLTLLLFMGYLALRRFGGGDAFGRKLAAGVAALALPAIYFIRMAVKLFGGNHPPNLAKGGYTSDPDMRLAFQLGIAAVFALALALTLLRFRQRRLEDEVEGGWRRAQDAGLDLASEDR